MAKRVYAPKIPFQLDSSGLNFTNIDDPLQNCKQLLRMLVLTNPGEKLMDPLFGVGVRRLLFENNSGIVDYQYSTNSIESIVVTDFVDVLRPLIKNQISKYAPDIYLDRVDVSKEEDILYLSIYYNYKGYIADVLQMQIS